MWVNFKNKHGRIRGAAGNWKKVYEFLITVEDYVGEFEGTLNNITVNYGQDVNNHDSQAHRFWSAATVLTALEEIHKYTTEDGINNPPDKLDINLSRNSQGGYASMRKFIGNAYFWTTVLDGLLNNLANTGNDPFLEFLGDVLGLLPGPYIVSLFFPDVNIGTNFNDSDQLKNLAYHELSHTSHFTQVGEEYWKVLIEAEVAANGWGNANSWEAGRIQICESWAEHIGFDYTHREYGASNSLMFIAPTWAVWEERIVNMAGHVPVGIHNDLIDVGEPTTTGITDLVSGYTNASLFDILDATIIDRATYNTALNAALPPGATAASVNTLFSSYP